MIIQIPTRIKAIMDTFNDGGIEVRLAGGCVRDIIMGRVPHDYDIATSSLPEDVISFCKQAGIRVIETGLKHGTVTAIFGDDQIEITTLRKDVSCDGRHAEVQFINDWREDALRRDFTINAMMADRDGIVYDWCHGIFDLEHKLIRFAGEYPNGICPPSEQIRIAEKRITEDNLRVFRAIRFSVKFGFILDYFADVAICETSWRENRLSKERIMSEMEKITSTTYHQASSAAKAVSDDVFISTVGMSRNDVSDRNFFTEYTIGGGFGFALEAAKFVRKPYHKALLAAFPFTNEQKNEIDLFFQFQGSENLENSVKFWLFMNNKTVNDSLVRVYKALGGFESDLIGYVNPVCEFDSTYVKNNFPLLTGKDFGDMLRLLRKNWFLSNCQIGE